MNYGKLFYTAKKEQEKKEKLIKKVSKLIGGVNSNIYLNTNKELKKMIKRIRKCK